MIRLAILLGSLALVAVVSAAPTASAPATLSKEADLTTITLKPEAEQRLRLKVVPIERRKVAATRQFAGEVVVGIVGAPGRIAPVVGGTLDENLRLADAQAVADGRMLQAQAVFDAAATALSRAQKVLRAEAGSERAVDEARSTHAQADAALRTARAQRELLGAPVGSARRLWVRAAIYSGEAGLLDPKASAGIRALSSSAATLTAAPVVGPMTAHAATATIDWYYELPAGVALRAGERVAVELPTLDSKTESLVVPFSAVLHDIHGGQWVYENTAPHAYARRRVQVARLSGADAVLASGPAAGTKVVTDGAAELFGTEFMTGK